MRLQKFLARAGVASRRASERIIEAGRVRVDGEVVTRLGTTVDAATQVVEVDGRPVRLPGPQWLMLHKPPGWLCSRDDPGGRPIVYELIPPAAASLFHVGRLDYMSEGLLLFTNEGDIAHGLLHPSSEISRRYVVTLVGPVSQGVPRRLVAGVDLEDGPAAAETARWLDDPGTGSPRLELTLTEGRNREVRRMMAELGLRIRSLRREAFGPVELGELPTGQTRALTDAEVSALRAIVSAAGRRGSGEPAR
ncbi:MAG: pseudouridine synthase [Gemmatimonadota bacterium]|nr:pseudouridine synthase [Gemmatimonadota bacterium]